MIELTSLDTAFAIRPTEEAAARRRLMTLVARTPSDEPVEPGEPLGQNEVLHAVNASGEQFAVKRLRPLPADTDPWARKGREAALFEEYRNHLACAHLHGFPRLYGFGMTSASEPVIIMEWIEGPTLLEALPALPHAQGLRGQQLAGLTAEAMTAVAEPLWEVLASTANLEGTFAHRDISLRNIMLKGCGNGAEALATAVRTGTLDPYLIDLGSSIFVGRDYASFTMTTDVWRYATPDYAPPEMLAPRGVGAPEERCSPAVDVYELSGVLYRLYSGRAPFDLSAAPATPAWKRKAEGRPCPLTARDARDEPLVQTIMAGLATEQCDRPTTTEMLDAFRSWREAAGLPRMASEGTAPGRQAAAAADGDAHRGHLTSPASARPVAGDSHADRDVTGSDAAAADKLAPASAPAHDGAEKLNRPLSRRALVAGGIALAGVAAAGAAAVLTRGFGLMGPRPFSSLSWDEIADLSARLAAATSDAAALQIAREAGILDTDDSLRVDLTRGLQLADGTSATVQLIDFRHDDKPDDGGKAGLTFAFTTPVAKRPMSPTTMAHGGWRDCELRSWLNGDFLGQLPTDVSKLITPVAKLANNEGASTSADVVSATTDRLWLFSIVELGGTRDASTFREDYRYLAQIQNAEGSQYRLWDQQGVSPNGANPELQRRYDGSLCYWWLRSASADTSAADGETLFNRVGRNGDPFHFALASTGNDDVTCVVPGFCI